MQTSEALAILQSLADGLDPISGQAFPAQSPYQHPIVVRALFRAIQALEHAHQREHSAKQSPTKAGKPWDVAEDAQLLADFDWGMSIKESAHKHQRTIGAIQSRLLRLGRLTTEATS
jgi:hypothetical protein